MRRRRRCAVGVDRLDDPVQAVGHAEESGGEHVLRERVDRLRQAALDHVAAVHHHDVVGDRQRLVLVVRDEHGGDAEPLLHRADLVAHPAAQTLVEVAQRLVEQQHLRLADQRPGQRDPLLLAAGERRRRAVGEIGEADHVQRVHRRARGRGLLRPRARRRAAGTSRSASTVMCGQIAYDWKTMPIGRRCAPTKTPRAGSETTWPPISMIAGVGALQPGDQPQRRGLAAAARAEQGDQLAVGNVQVDAVDGVGGDGAARVTLGQSGQLDHRAQLFRCGCVRNSDGGRRVGGRTVARRRSAVGRALSLRSRPAG